MTHPYRYKPDHAFWSRGVSAIPLDDFDPVTAVPFLIGRDEKVSAAGSCFAQHISRFLQAEGFGALVTEPAPLSAGAWASGLDLKVTTPVVALMLNSAASTPPRL